MLRRSPTPAARGPRLRRIVRGSEEHTSELQSQSNLVCRLLLEKKNNTPEASGRKPGRARPRCAARRKGGRPPRGALPSRHDSCFFFLTNGGPPKSPLFPLHRPPRPGGGRR